MPQKPFNRKKTHTYVKVFFFYLSNKNKFCNFAAYKACIPGFCHLKKT